MRILITGITGFVGGHLARLLLRHGAEEVIGFARDQEWSRESEDVAERVALYPIDLTDRSACQALLRSIQPAQIYHLAGYADTGSSFREPEAAWEGNLTATRGLYEAVLGWGGRPRILYIGSGSVYGEPSDAQRPLDEETTLRPNNPYAASKAAADLASYQYFRTHGLEIIRTRPFNHVGPGQSPRFAVPNFARQIAAIERGQAPPVLRVGNLNSERDLTDVRDVVRAYQLLIVQGQPGEVYNVASGRSLPVRVHLEKLLSLSKVSVQVEEDPALVRRVDTTAVRVSIRRLQETTGWTPQFTLEQTLADTLEYWRRMLGSG
jgi:GDP-4-dehydro-6-deoxy-D-mannose reductase